MGGEDINRLDQVFDDLDPVWWALSELESLQEVLCNREPITGMCGDYMGTCDVLREVIGSNIENEDNKE